MGLGCNAFGRRIDEQQIKSVIDSAIDNYITFSDTADSYGNGLSEEFIGRAVKGRRTKIVIATKFGRGNLYSGKSHGPRENIRVAIDKSRHRLQTDFIELYQLHKPDPSCPIVETLHALEELVQEEKIGFYGCSNFSASQLTKAIEVANRDGLQGFVTAQNSWSLMDRSIESELLDVCKKKMRSVFFHTILWQGAYSQVNIGGGWPRPAVQDWVTMLLVPPNMIFWRSWRRSQGQEDTIC